MESETQRKVQTMEAKKKLPELPGHAFPDIEAPKSLGVRFFFGSLK